jgi:hypothetical protein
MSDRLRQRARRPPGGTCSPAPTDDPTGHHPRSPRRPIHRDASAVAWRPDEDRPRATSGYNLP